MLSRVQDGCLSPVAEGLEGKADIVHVADATAALDRLAAMLVPGDAVLIKGSNGVGLSRVVAGLKGGKT